MNIENIITAVTNRMDEILGEIANAAENEEYESVTYYEGYIEGLADALMKIKEGEA